MQAINVGAERLPLMALFFGTALGCGVGIAAALPRWNELDGMARLLGSALYLIGCIGVTIIVHVPRTDALAAVDAASPDGAAL
jgi:uncharacterized membrane protein